MFNLSLNELLQSLTFDKEMPLVFNSVLFIGLFTIMYVFYVASYKKLKIRNAILLVFSLYFYYRISGFYVVLLVLMATSDFLIGKQMFNSKKTSARKAMLMLSLLINLGILILFKYTNFFLDLFFGITTGQPSPVILNLIVPIGISYFVFKTLTYIFDIYRGMIEKPEKNYLNYLLYVSFFPNILAGPILRAKDLLPQFREKLNLSKAFISGALLLIIIGAFKKVFIADFLAVNFVDRVFDSPEYFSAFEYLMAGYGFLIQLYFDFSGYTDMVIGIAMLLGFTEAANFNKPFLAQNITDFWRRWHITLSTWLRDYLFSPLSVSMRSMGNAGLFLSIIITFIICGFWHGASLTFIAWGTLHGLFMGWDIISRKRRLKIQKKMNKGLYRVISIIITFNLLMLTFILFKATDIETAWSMIRKIFTAMDFSLAGQWVELYKFPLIIMVLGLLLHYTPMKWNVAATKLFSRFHWTLQALLIFIAIIFIYQSFSTEAQPFIYLEF